MLLLLLLLFLLLLSLRLFKICLLPRLRGISEIDTEVGC